MKFMDIYQNIDSLDIFNSLKERSTVIIWNLTIF